VIELVILDVNGSLSSLDAVAERLADVGLEGQLDVWFARILRDGFAAAAAGAFAPFPALARHHTAVLLESHGRTATEERLDLVLDGFLQVTAHPDVEPGLQRLRDAGVTVTTMTNGTVEITRRFLEREGLEALVDATYDVSQAGRWKPAPEAYHYVLDRHAVDRGSAALIAIHPWDVHGAIRAGLKGAWVDRDGQRYPEVFERPDTQGASFGDVVERLIAGGSDA
jgi:2-haloacid dehalogenase